MNFSKPKCFCSSKISFGLLKDFAKEQMLQFWLSCYPVFLTEDEGDYNHSMFEKFGSGLSENKATLEEFPSSFSSSAFLAVSLGFTILRM